MFSTSYPWTNRSGAHRGEDQLSDRRRWTVQEELGTPNGHGWVEERGRAGGSAEGLAYRLNDTA